MMMVVLKLVVFLQQGKTMMILMVEMVMVAVDVVTKERNLKKKRKILTKILIKLLIKMEIRLVEKKVLERMEKLVRKQVLLKLNQN